MLQPCSTRGTVHTPQQLPQLLCVQATNRQQLCHASARKVARSIPVPIKHKPVPGVSPVMSLSGQTARLLNTLAVQALLQLEACTPAWKAQRLQAARVKAARARLTCPVLPHQHDMHGNAWCTSCLSHAAIHAARCPILAPKKLHQLPHRSADGPGNRPSPTSRRVPQTYHSHTRPCTITMGRRPVAYCTTAGLLPPQTMHCVAAQCQGLAHAVQLPALQHARAERPLTCPPATIHSTQQGAMLACFLYVRQPTFMQVGRVPLLCPAQLP